MIAPARNGHLDTRAVSTRALSNRALSNGALLLVLAATILRLLLAAVVPLFPDETYYWEWSRHLAAGYFDHPPAIAFLIRAGTVVFGATALGVRAGVVLAGAIASWSVIALSERLYAPGNTPGVAPDAAPDAAPDVAPDAAPDAAPNTRSSRGLLADAGTRAALLTGIIPVALVGFVLATPDAPLLAAIALSLVAVERALASVPTSRAALGWWTGAGIAMGLAFAAKYTAVLLPLGVVVALLVRPTLRSTFTRPGPYVATVAALLVFLPTLLWNAQHQWVSFAFQFQHGLGTPRGSALTRELNLIGGQLGLMSPVLAVLAAVAVARSLRTAANDREFLLAVVATTVVAFFSLSALRRPVEPNWPAPALLAALPLLAAVPAFGTYRKWFVGGCVLAAVITVLLLLQATAGALRLSPRRDPVARAYGWQDLAQAVSGARAVAPRLGCGVTWVSANRYQDASELAYHLPAHPRIFSLNVGGRPNQYDLWPSLASVARAGDCLIFVSEASDAGTATAMRVVQHLEANDAAPLATALMRRGQGVIARRTIWLLRGIRPQRPAATSLSPAAEAGIAVAAQLFPRNAALLDSAVVTFRHGPAPFMVSVRDTSATLGNADRRASIAARIVRVRQLLERTNALSIYRDSRHRECTFVRMLRVPRAEVGYLRVARGCDLSRISADGVYVRPLSGEWYLYAAE